VSLQLTVLTDEAQAAAGPARASWIDTTDFATPFSDSPGNSSVAYCDPEHALAVAMVFNGMPGNEPHYRRLETVSTALYEDLGLSAPGAPGRDHPCPAITGLG